MSADDDPIGETDLLAFVDGHLEPRRHRRVTEYLASHPEEATRVAADRAINQAIRRLFERYYEEEPPHRLTAMLTHGRRRPPRGRWPIRVAAALALLLGGGAGGWWLSTHTVPSASLAGLERFTNGPLKPASFAAAVPTQQPPAKTREPVEWLAEGLRQTARVPDLGSAGLRLVGQTIVGSADRPALQLTYEDPQGGRVYLFLQTRWDDLEPRLQLRQGGDRGVVYWAEGPVLFAITGDAPPEDLRLLAETVQQAAPAPSAAPKISSRP